METLHVEAVKVGWTQSRDDTHETFESDSRAFCSGSLLMCQCVVCIELGMLFWMLIEEPTRHETCP